jgi:hypothetical protein
VEQEGIPQGKEIPRAARESKPISTSRPFLSVYMYIKMFDYTKHSPWIDRSSQRVIKQVFTATAYSVELVVPQIVPANKFRGPTDLVCRAYVPSSQMRGRDPMGMC